MNRSGIKRGLAISAVSGLALAGLATAPAQAQTIDDRLDGADTTVLYNPEDFGPTVVSTQNDGTNSLHTLLAGAPTEVGGVTVNAIHFTSNGVPALDVTIPVASGVAEYNWDVPTSASSVTAQAVSAANVPLGTADTDAIDATGAPTNASVAINGALRDKLGYFSVGGSNFAGVTGFTRGSLAVTKADVLDTDTGAITTSVLPVSPNGPAVGTLSPWGAVVDVPSGLLNADVADDDVVISGRVSAGDTEGNAFSMYKQTVTGSGVTAPVAPGYSANTNGDLNAANPTLPGGGAPDGTVGNDITQYLVTVTDQLGKPVAGVPTYEANAAGFATNGAIRDSSNAIINGATPVSTDFTGTRRLTFSETTMDNFQDLDPAPNVQATYIVVDLNGDGIYQNSGDILLKLSQTNAPQAPASITLVNKLPATAPSVANATVQDDDECGDVTVTVKDANGDPVQNVTPTITVTKTTNGGTPVVTHPAVTGPTNPAGQTHVVGCLQGSNDDQTTIKVEASTINGTNASPLVVESDQADVVWDEGEIDQVLHGTSVTEGAALELPSGAGLPGRTVGLVFDNGGGIHNATFAPQAEQPAGIVSGTPTTATATTGTDGTFSVKVTDPALPNGEELGDTITATAPALSSLFDTIDSVLTIDFLRSLTATSVVIYNDDNGTTSTVDGLDGDFENQQSNGGLLPDSMAEGGITAFNADGVTLTDLDVTVTIDQGHFSKRDDPFKATPAPGAIFEMNDIGKTITINTTDDGIGEFYANIERNTGFDDDGIVEDQLHASVGSVSDDHDFTWTTVGTPITQRQTDGLVVSLSGDQQSSILPQARAGTGNSAQAVFYDVKTYDHYDNPTSQVVSVTDNTPVGEIADPDGGGFESELALGQPAIVATSPSTANQAIDVEINNSQKRVYKDNVNDSSFDPANPNDQVEVLFTDVQRTTDPINWYTVNLNDPSLYTLTQEGSENVPVGSTVSYTLTAIDPEGQPINGSGVGFLRVGPGDQGQDDDGQAGDVTNADGEAFYDFAGSVPGTASVSAVVYDDEGIIGLGGFHRLFVVGPDTVTFGGTVVAIHPKLTGENSEGKDVLTINSRKAAGASVKLFKKTGHGRVLLKVGQLNVNGIKSFKVTDKNGNQVTKYFAIVSNTPRTQRGVTNTVNLR